MMTMKRLGITFFLKQVFAYQISSFFSSEGNDPTVLADDDAPGDPCTTLPENAVRVGDKFFNLTLFLPETGGQTRYDGSSRIANICTPNLILFGTDHQKLRGGFGLASEFGCDRTGATCAAGSLTNVTTPPEYANGILGFQDGLADGEFLKIGVGSLIRPASGEDGYEYDPNHTYAFKDSEERDHEWVVTTEGYEDRNDMDGLYKTVVLSQSVTTANEEWGYELRTTISTASITATDSDAAIRQTLHIRTELKNIGTRKFATPHYSSNMMSVSGGDPTHTRRWKLLHTVPQVQEREEVENVDITLDQFLEPFGEKLEQYNNVGGRIAPAGQYAYEEFVGNENFGANNSWSGNYSRDEIFLVINSQQQQFTVPDDGGEETPNAAHDLWEYRLLLQRDAVSPRPFQSVVLEANETVSWNRTISFHYQGALGEDATMRVFNGFWYSVNVLLIIASFCACGYSKGKVQARLQLDKIEVSDEGDPFAVILQEEPTRTTLLPLPGSSTGLELAAEESPKSEGASPPPAPEDSTKEL